MHKNRAANAISIQNSVHNSSFRTLKGRGGGVGGGPRANHELPHQARGHPFFYSSRCEGYVAFNKISASIEDGSLCLR